MACGCGMNASAEETGLPYAGNDNTGTLQPQPAYPMAEKRNFTDSRLYQMTFVGVPLVVTGLIMKGEDTHFRSLRSENMEKFHRPFDNYTQYVPGAVMLGMKAFGVKGRSSWGRMMVSDAFSAAIMASVVQSMKHTTHVMRIANNKHWLSDVLTGAGIGILSTEFGYYLADLIFKDKGINRFDRNETFSRADNPSFLGLYLGLNIPLSHYDITEGVSFHTSSGSSAGVEGAYFFTPYIGVGGRFAVSSTHIITESKQDALSTASQIEESQSKSVAENDNFDAVSVMAGPYFSYPLTSRWTVGSKLLAGYVNYSKLELSDGTEVPQHHGVGFGSGLSFAYQARERYGIRFFLDYNLQPSHSKESGEWMSTLAVGTNSASTSKAFRIRAIPRCRKRTTRG